MADSTSTRDRDCSEGPQNKQRWRGFVRIRVTAGAGYLGHAEGAELDVHLTQARAAVRDDVAVIVAGLDEAIAEIEDTPDPDPPSVEPFLRALEENRPERLAELTAEHVARILQQSNADGVPPQSPPRQNTARRGRLPKDAGEAWYIEMLAQISQHPTLQNDPPKLAELLDVSESTVRRWLKKARQDFQKSRPQPEEH